ncbi:MAG TPA: isocitrate lyase/phosphoenolpyruvate mutase family protein [Nitrososphaerales archaeon]|nr:isocitrate lyase/phosphoenolpyruvate mutase family protein [Nitrososphaerales archaeon]
MKSQAEKAEEFLSLHRRGDAFVLPNAWDVASARLFEEAGFGAVATSSAGLMVSLGYPDGQSIPRDVLVSAVGRMAGVLGVPLSADMVAGFGDSPGEAADSVRAVVEAGAVGVNIEDFDHATKKLYSVEAQVEKLSMLVKLKGTTGVPFVLNARTDAFRFAPGQEEERLKEAIRRAEAYRDLGADCVYPMGLVDANSIGAFVEELGCPVNVMVRKGLPPISELRQLGVARVSFGPSASYAAMGLLKRAAREIQEKGTFETLVEGAIGFDELNSLASPKP